jgi:ribonuclease HII
VTFPSLELEAELLKKYSAVIGMDEVGRGSLAGPVAVAALVLTNEQLSGQPVLLQDSKLVRETRRAELAVQARAWGRYAIAMVDAQLIDEHGIISALGRAGQACLEQLSLGDSVVILDGNQNWLERKDTVARTKADRDCASVAAASIIAKVERDSLMIELAEKYPDYGFDSNKGYSSAQHIEALRRRGPCQIHRRSWLKKSLARACSSWPE